MQRPFGLPAKCGRRSLAEQRMVLDGKAVIVNSVFVARIDAA
jgi:hypothetical protein